MTPVILIKSEQLSDSIFTFWFKPTQVVNYTAGQFVEIRLTHESDNRGQTRWFTLSSSPTEPYISITTRLATTPSSFKTALFKLKHGDTVEVSQAMGDFVLPMQKSLPILFVARGIGITPVRSITKQLDDESQQRDISLVYSVQTKTDEIFDDTLNKILTNVKYRISSDDTAATEVNADIMSTLEDKPTTRVYLSGPEKFVESLYKILRTNGVSDNNLLTDYFHGYDA